MQKNKGITLVALVITIIILLILAGVAISMITGGEGLFAQANGAATKYNQAAKNEADMLNQLLNGNYTFGGNEETPKEPVPDLIKKSNMDFIYKPDTWISGTVNVEITTEITGYTLQYSLNEGETWDNYTEEIPVTTNGKVILARLADGDRTGGIATGQVENIDTQGPKAFNLIATAGGTRITVSAEETVEDADEIEGVSGKSGIRGYQFKLMNNDGTTKIDWTTEQPEPSYIFNEEIESETTYKVSMKAIDNAENPTEATNGVDGTASVTTKEMPQVSVGEKTTEPSTIDGKKGAYNNPIIPEGFKAINVGEATWGSQDGWNKGLVIQDAVEGSSTIGSEFVWVPVKVSISEAIQTKLNNGTPLTVAEIQSTWSRKAWEHGSSYTKSTRGTLYTDYTEPLSYNGATGYEGENDDYIEMGTSVLKNGGFYVGRYEGGTETPRTSSSDETSTLLSKAHVYPYTCIAWGKSMSDISKPDDCGSKGAVEICREMYTGKNGYSIKSSLIYGVQWDSIMEWIEGERNVSNSTEWGNYWDRAYTIKVGTEYYDSAYHWLGWQIAEKDIEKRAKTDRFILKTGEFAEKVTKTGVIKNIYDLAGNCWEWTMEAEYGDYRVVRGAASHLNGDWYPASERYNTKPNQAGSATTLRCALYL